MKMNSNEIETLDQVLIRLTDEILSTKNTSLLQSFGLAIDKALKDRSIDCKNTLLECLNKLNKLLPSKCLQKLIAKAITLKDVDICLSYLDNVQIVSESDAISILKLFIEIENDVETNRSRLEERLTKIFSIDYDYAFMAKELQKLSSKEFIVCLYNLRNTLKTYFRNENSPMNTSTSSGGSQMDEETQNKSTPKLKQIINLLNCLIDAHFTHITLSNESQEIIADLLQLVESQVDAFTDVIAIESLLKESRTRGFSLIKNRQSNERGNYSIEVLKI